MKSSVIILLLAFCLSCFTVNAQYVNLTSLLCEDIQTNTSYSRGDTAIICIHFVNANLNLRMPYKIIVDEYSSLEFKGAQQSFQADGGPPVTGILAQVSLQKSSAVDYINKTTTPPHVYTVFSIVIEVDNGIVQSIYWDNGCFGATPCSDDPDLKLVDTNGAPYKNLYDTDCNTIRTADYLCDPKVYVSWIGTDSNGLKMESAGLRISAFRKYSFGDIYSSAKRAIDNAYENTKADYCKLYGNCTVTPPADTPAETPAETGARI